MKKEISQIINSKYTFYTLIILMAIWHLWSLPFSPLPWFDETFFASITQSLMNGKGFILSVCPIQTQGKEVLTYGPIYFILTSITCKIFGLTLSAFRIVNLVFASLSIVVFYKLLTQIGVKESIAKLFILFLTFDVIYIQNAHSGRMDLVAFFFAISSYYLYFKNHQTLYHTAIISLLITFSLLTTPRIVVIVFPLFGLLMYDYIRSKDWRKIFVLTIVPSILFLAWIYYGFGSITSFINYYINPGTDGHSSNKVISYIGGNLYVPFFQIPLIISAIGVSIYLLNTSTSKKVLLIFTLPILLFYIIIKDTGAYTTIVVAFWYILLAMGTQTILSNNQVKPIIRLTLISALVIIMTINIGIFTLKSLTIIGSLSERNPKAIEKWTTEYLPEGSRVVGDDRYYYACINQGCEFQYLDRVESNDQRALYHAKNFKPTHLFISSQTPKETIEAYQRVFDFESEIEYNPLTNDFLQKIISKLPMAISSSYQGKLIKIKCIKTKGNENSTSSNQKEK